MSGPIELTTATAAQIDGIRDSLLIEDDNDFGIVRYRKTSWTNLSDFTVVGAAPTIVNGAIRFSAAFGNWDSSRIMIPAVRAESEWTFSVKLRFNDLNTGFGIAIGKSSVNGWGYKQSVACSLPPKNDYAMAIYGNFEGTIPGSTLVNTAIPVFAKDELIEITAICRRSVVTFTARNVTTGAQVVLSTVATTNCGRFGIANLGSSVDVLEITYQADIPKNPRQVFFVDSKGAGTPGDNYTSWIHRLSQDRNIAIFGGPADRTVELIQAIADFPTEGVTDAVFGIGRNDAASGVASAVTQGNILTIRALMTPQAARITHVIIPETTQSQSVMTAWVASSLPSDGVVDLSGYDIPTMEYSDFVHPNVLGQIHISRQGEKKLSPAASDLPLNQSIVQNGRLDGTVRDSNLRSLGVLEGLSVSGNSTITGNGVFGTVAATGVSTASPNTLSLGSTYGNNATGNRANTKLFLYQDTAGNIYGFGQTASASEYYAATGGNHKFFSGEILVFHVGPGTLGFYGKTAVSQPAAIPTTSGANLAALEAEVNKLKTALNSLGLIA